MYIRRYTATTSQFILCVCVLHVPLACFTFSTDTYAACPCPSLQCFASAQSWSTAATGAQRKTTWRLWSRHFRHWDLISCDNRGFGHPGTVAEGNLHHDPTTLGIQQVRSFPSCKLHPMKPYEALFVLQVPTLAHTCRLTLRNIAAGNEAPPAGCLLSSKLTKMLPMHLLSELLQD